MTSDVQELQVGAGAWDAKSAGIRRDGDAWDAKERRGVAGMLDRTLDRSSRAESMVSVHWTSRRARFGQ